MATVRISSNWRNPNKKEWAGAPALDSAGRIARSIGIPEAAYQAIERDIATGGIEGTRRGGCPVHWDRHFHR
jgi:hypothetical protein